MFHALIRYLAPCLLALTLAGVTTTAAAAPRTSQMLYLAQRDGGVSLEEATAMVRRETGGRVLSAETLSRGGSRMHRIKVLTEDNRVRIIQVDAATGERR